MSDHSDLERSRASFLGNHSHSYVDELLSLTRDVVQVSFNDDESVAC